MAEHCQIPRCIEKILAASHCSTAFIGGSLTVGVGASDTSRTSWRALFTEYLYREYHPKYHCQVSEIMGAIGASESYVAVFTVGRNVLPAKPDLAFVEFCVNDMGVPDRSLVVKGMEGIVRQLLTAKNSCDVIILGTGNRDSSVPHDEHRQIAEYYDLPFIDLQNCLPAKLKDRGQTWENVALEFETNDPYHLNDYGQRLSFEAIRECFEEQLDQFRNGARKDRNAPVPEPLAGDEFEFLKLVDPAKKNPNIKLHGTWNAKDDGHIPWYFDNLLAGQPGATLTFTFQGTAVAVFGLMYNNGLKLEAELDGEDIAGPYLRHFIEFGKGMVLGHGLPHGEHVLKLTVAQPSKRHNKLQNPTAQIGCLGVACKPG